MVELFSVRSTTAVQNGISKSQKDDEKICVRFCFSRNSIVE